MPTTIDTAALTDRGPFAASEDELKSLQRVTKALNQSEAEPVTLVTAAGEEFALSPTLLRALRVVAATLAADRAVVLDSYGRLVTPYQAAELIGVSSHYVDRLLTDGTLSFANEGTGRLLSRDEVLAFRETFKAQQREALAELTRISEELGLYELDYSPIKVKRLSEFEEAQQSDDDNT